jgi:hypothetical protein
MATVCPYIAIFMIDTFFYLSQHFADITASVNSLFQNLLGDITYVVCGFPKSATLFQLSRKGSTVTQSGRPTVYAYRYFMEDFKTANGLNFVVAMIYFYSFNIFVFMILFNFLLAIICDAFGEVKANASESVSVSTELGPMLNDSWRSTFRSFYRNHVPESRVR